MSTHNMWVGLGKPRSGPIFLERNQAKYNYRWQIKKNKASEKDLITDKLKSELYYKSKTQFWKTWKNKFKVQN